MFISFLVILGLSSFSFFELGASTATKTCDAAEIDFKAGPGADYELLDTQGAPDGSGFLFFYGDEEKGPAIISAYLKEGVEKNVKLKLELLGVCLTAVNKPMNHYIIRKLPAPAPEPAQRPI